MDIEILSSLVVQEYVEEKVKALVNELGLKENIFKELEKDIREISMYIINKINNNLKIESFNEENLENLYREGFKKIIGKILDNIPNTVKNNNVLIKKFIESSEKGDKKAFLYYLFIKELLNKESNKNKENLMSVKSNYEVVIH
ncbi:MAG: hypothetical protein BXU00_01290 [Candidatus Nanoclepta minutus]|uniref:Uncharacterized protein n=1 Tax=Candidatus Nanoclepta minutus TaxID=1940235 RepID=A0A397WN88_9ARCH|nr:MAG: hypothetical protein BXU00_01290 [Candidatus Nanoclepta minutus]